LARIDGLDKVIVYNPEVENPVAVRFGWANYPVVNLWNKTGLPASPFRTDDFAK
jgi:sialate O-acetylesterase